MALKVAELSLELIEELRPLVPRIKQKDKSLADQIMRSSSSIALNLGEAELSDPGNRAGAILHGGRQRRGDVRGGARRDRVAVLCGEGRRGGGGAAPAHHRHSLETDALRNERCRAAHDSATCTAPETSRRALVPIVTRGRTSVVTQSCAEQSKSRCCSSLLIAALGAR
jgi:hypothetical protein